MPQRYRALVGIKSADGMTGKEKAVREAYHIELMKTLLDQWDSTLSVVPYYDKSCDPDRLYQQVLRQHQAFAGKANVNIDDPKSVLNLIGQRTGHIFYSEIPPEDKKQREKDRAAFEKEKDKYRKQHKKFPDEIKERYEYLVEEPSPAPKTKLYAYSVINPNGMFQKYDFPIVNAYNGIDLHSSKLLNRNYGTYHDILTLGELDFEGTYLPTVVFLDQGIMFESDEADEIEKFLNSHLKKKDYIAMIECEM